MKYTIYGFQQTTLVGLGLDNNDALILRWFVDFYHTGKMAIVSNKDKNFLWVSYQAVIDDLPILGINSKDSIARRFKKITESGVFEHYTHRAGGTFSCYRLNESVYSDLISVGQSTQKSEPSDPNVGTPSDPNVGTKDPSTIINSTTKNNNIPIPAERAKKQKTTEQIAADEKIKSCFEQVLQICNNNNHTINPDKSMTDGIYATIKREGTERTIKALNNYFIERIKDPKYSGTIKSLIYNAGSFARFANMESETEIKRTWEPIRKDKYGNTINEYRPTGPGSLY